MGTAKLPLPPPPPAGGTSRAPPPPSRKAAPLGAPAQEEEELEFADDEDDDERTLEAPPVIEAPTFVQAKADSEPSLGSAPFIDAASDPDPDDDEDLEEVSAVDHPMPLNLGLEKVVDDDSDDAATRVLGRDLLGSSGPVYVAPHTPPPSEAPPPSQQEIESFPPPPNAPRDLGRYGEIGRRSLETLPQKLKDLPQTLKALPQTVAQLPRRVQIGGAAGLAALVGLVGWAASGSDGESKTDEASETVTGSASSAAKAATAAPAPPEVESCSLRSPAARLAEFAHATVQPLLVRIPGSQRVAVGYAQASDYAMGITVDPVTLDKDQVFRNFRAKNEVVTVAPVTASDKLRFEVVRKNDKLSPAAIVNVDPPFRIGKGEEGLLRAALDRGSPEVVYTIGEEDITPPKVATLGSTGHAVAVRRGGTNGVVNVGTLTPTGSKLTDLRPVDSKAEFSGTPAVAAKDDALLVAFAARNGNEGDWFLALSTVRGGDAPSSATQFTPPPGGPGQNLISPALAASEKGWVIQWTEGKSGNRVVRLQTLDRDLKPTGKALNLSPSDVNAGGGAIWVDGSDVISLFFVQKGKGHELWGAPLACTQ